MPHLRFAPTRSLPVKPNLDQLRKQAKELLKAYVAGEPAAVTEVEQFEWKPDPTKFALADAQRLLARAYGFSSWTRLKHHVDGVNVEAFCEAAEAGDVAKVRQLAAARPDLVSVARGGTFGETTALHFAVLNRDAAMIQALMELGSDAHKGIWPHRDATAAFTIAQERGYDEIVAIIQLREQRRRQELSTSGETINSNPDEVHRAVVEGRGDDAIRLLESDLSLIGACNDQGVTALHAAAWAQDTEMVAWLLERHAPVNAKARRDVRPHHDQTTLGSGRTPLDYAAIVAGWAAHGQAFCFLEHWRNPPERFRETVRLLRSEGAMLTPRAAVAIGDQQAVDQMHREGRWDNEVHFFRGGLLSIAVRTNQIEMLSMLLDLGLDPDEPAAIANDGSRSWGMPLWFAAMCGRHEIAEMLLARGADVNAIVSSCGDALCIADGTGDEKMQNMLLEHGARITVERVASSRNVALAEKILAGTVSAQSLNVDEPSLADLAEQMLWAAGPHEPEIVRMCLPLVTRERDDPWWNDVLVHATLPDCVELILKHGVDPDVLGRGGYALLHHLATVQVSDGERIATMLLEAGASLDRRDSLLLSTPLGWACRWGHRELVQLYLSRGADPLESDAEPWATPLAWSTKAGHLEIAELLRSRGAT